MQTPLNSSETKAVISETPERDPSFLHQLQNKHVGQSFQNQLITKEDKNKRKKKVITNQLGFLSKKKKIKSFFIKFIFKWEGFFLPTHTLRVFSEGQKVGQGKV